MSKTIAVRLFAITSALVVGCDEGANRIVEQPDAEKMQAKKQEFADFQKKMAEQSKLPGQR